MNPATVELQHRIETASALKRLVVRRCLQEISSAEFDRARAEIIGRWRDDKPAPHTDGPTAPALPHRAASASP